MSSSSYLHIASILICEMIPRIILSNDMSHLLIEIFGHDINVKLSLL